MLYPSPRNGNLYKSVSEIQNMELQFHNNTWLIREYFLYILQNYSVNGCPRGISTLNHDGYYVYHQFLALNFSIFPVKYIYTFRIILRILHPQTGLCNGHTFCLRCCWNWIFVHLIRLKPNIRQNYSWMHRYSTSFRVSLIKTDEFDNSFG
jgi:hypothetical protein